MQKNKPILKKVLGLVEECWPSLRSSPINYSAPCQQQRLFPSAQGWRHLRLMGFRCLEESHLGYDFEITLECAEEVFRRNNILELQAQNSFSKIALWLTREKLSGCQTVAFHGQQVPLCQALASIDFLHGEVKQPSNLAAWLSQQGTMPKGRFTILKCWQHGENQTLSCRTTDCLSRATYHWLQQQAIRYQLIYVR